MRVLLVEDDVPIAEQLMEDLKEAGHGCFWRATVREALDDVNRVEPELVLLDLALPDGTGFDFLTAFRERSSVPVIVLTAKLMSDDKIRALDMGADDYVTKPFWTEELLARMRSVMRRYMRTPEPLSTRRFGDVVVDMKAMTAKVGGASCNLTPTEFDLLAYFIQRPNQALRRERLAHCVLESDDAGAGALQVHISRLRRKLGEDGKRVKTVWGIGYRFDLE